MKSYWMESNGETADISLREVAVPVPAANQLLVKMHAASLNRGEFILAHGLHKAGAAKPIGTDGSGVVEAIGADVTGFKVGDRVMGRCAGAFSEYALMSTAEAMHIPANLGWEASASVPLTGHVVFDMLVLQGRLVKDEWLLINGVASGVGVAALQMAKAIGAKVIGTSGSFDKLARLKSLGLDVGICTRQANRSFNIPFCKIIGALVATADTINFLAFTASKLFDCCSALKNWSQPSDVKNPEDACSSVR